ncbi:hypothetical protein U9R90_19155 [Streptomyces sp. E11-3]|uniref:hypothetical protein n=1 Tax=Streptomyces sp. E11-3 TaxID=3110112 RepID=UPI00398133CA
MAQGQDDDVLEAVETHLRGRVPATTRVSSVDLRSTTQHAGSRRNRSRSGNPASWRQPRCLGAVLRVPGRLS